MNGKDEKDRQDENQIKWAHLYIHSTGIITKVPICHNNLTILALGCCNKPESAIYIYLNNEISCYYCTLRLVASYCKTDGKDKDAAHSFFCHKII